MKKNPLLGIGLLVAGGLVANEMLKPPADATKTTNTLGFTGNESDTEFAEKMLTATKGNKELQRLLKGEQGLTGATGAAGATGATGTPGAAGDILHNYGGSLLKNGALELGDTQSWLNAGNIELPLVKVENSNVLRINATAGSKYCPNSTKVFTKKAVLKLTFKYKSVGAASFFRTYFQDLDLAPVTPAVGSATYVDSTLSATTTYTSKTVYISGLSAGSYFNDAKTIKLAIFANTGADFYMYDLVAEFVSLGEPVPYNLPHLPTGQMVVDTTTGECGWYNGTAISWYAL